MTDELHRGLEGVPVAESELSEYVGPDTRPVPPVGER